MAHLAQSAPVSAHEKLPHYEHPPLVEVVLGARFAETRPLDEHAAEGLLERLGPAWHRAPRTPSPRSSLPQSWTHPGMSFQSVLGEQRLELSADGFEFAWDGRRGDTYPHYEAVRDGFVVAWDAWNDWWEASGVRPPGVCGWKTEYLNCIPQGTVWSNLADCTFLRLLAPIPSGLPRLERCDGHWVFALERFEAALTCEVKTTAGTARDPRTCLWLRLMCTGAPAGEDGGVLAGLDYGRETIVRTFRQLMSSGANAYWKMDR